MGFDSILTTSPLVKAGSRGSPLGKKDHPRVTMLKKPNRVAGPIRLRTAKILL